MIPLVQLTDTQLVSIYQTNQDSVYFGELYNRYYKKVYYFCLGKLSDRDDAYDVTTDTFLKLTTKISCLKNPELFIAWLFRIASNACIDVLRAKSKNRMYDISDFDVEDDVNGLEELMMREAQLDTLDTILGTLDYETKTILINKYIKGKSIEDLEKEMGLSKSAVKMRLARGREKIAILWA
ncbi:MAG: RNA polymerase sigma-70 factor (ECF subfamily) [Saprospiraceae bacterium]|jgi:RNA polymerase sigma-70 factor (ECF subfamily)